MSQKLIIILILAILVPDTYIYKMFVARPEISPSLKVAFFIPTLLLAGGLVYLLWAGRGSSNPQLFGWFMMLYFFLTLPKLIFFIFSVIGLPFTYIGVSATPFHFVGILLGACVAVIIAYGMLIGKTRFDVKR